MDDENLIRIYEGEKIAEIYSKHRYSYPSEVSETVMGCLKKHANRKDIDGDKFDKMLDVGCGTGRSTHLFSQYFESILGIDISKAQIEQAKKINESPNVSFELVNGHMFPVEDSSIDLITCAAAAHWLDLEKFEGECQRVLKPKGCCVIYISTFQNIQNADGKDSGSNSSSNSTDFRDILTEYLDDIKAHEGNYIAHNGYTAIFDQIQNTTKRWIEGFANKRKLTLAQYKSYATSIGDYHLFMEKEKPKIDPLDTLCHKLKRLLNKENETDNNVEIIIEYQYRFIAFDKN